MGRAMKRMDSLGQSMTRVGRGLTAGLTLPLVAVGAGAIKAFSDFDSAMTGSLAIMGDVSEAMRGEMSAAAREVGKTTTFSATQAAESYFFLASAGLDAASSIAALPKVAAFAQAGAFDMALATDLLTDAQSALGMTIRDDVIANMENMVRVSDVLVKANTLANASVQQFSEALTNKAGAALRALGKDVEEGVAVLAAFADQGVKGAEAGTQFAIVLRDLQTKAITNKAAFEKFGVSVFDSSGEMRNMADIVSDMEGLLGGMSDAGKKATLMQLGFSDKSIAAMTALLGTSDAIREYESKLRSAAGITEEVADKQLESFAAKMGLVWDRVKDVGIVLGGPLSDALLNIIDVGEPVIQWAADLAQWFSDLSPGMKKVVLGAFALVAALGPLLLIFGQLAIAAAALAPFLFAVGASASTAGVTAAGGAVGLTTLGLALKFVGVASFAVAAAFAGWKIGEWIANSDLLGASQLTLGERLEFTATKAVNWWRGVEASNNDIELAIVSRRLLADSTTEIGVAHIDAAADVEAAISSASAAWATAVEGMDAVVDSADTATKSVKEATDGLLENANAWGPVERAAISLNVALSATAPTIEAFSATILRSNERLLQMPGTVYNVQKSVFELASSFKGATVEMTRTTAAVAEIKTTGVGLFDGMKSSLSGLLQGLTGGNGITGLFSNLGKGIMDGLGNIVSGGIASLMSSGVSAAVSGLKSLFGSIFGKSQGRKDLEDANAQIKILQDDLLKTYGSLDNIRTMGGAAGDALADAWGSQNVKGLEWFTHLLGKFNADMETAADAAERLAGELAETARRGRGSFADLTTDIERMQARLDNVESVRRLEAAFQSFREGGTFDLRTIMSHVEALEASLGSTNPTVMRLKQIIAHFAATGVLDFDALAAAFGELKKDMEVPIAPTITPPVMPVIPPIRVPVEFIIGDLAINGLNVNGTGLNNNDQFATSNFSSFEAWRESWLQRNPGDEHRIPSALGGAWNPAWGSRPPGFTHGTGGQFIDFGAGTPAVLHGRERVMTEGEGRADVEDQRSVRREISALRDDLGRLFRDQPRAIASAVESAVVLAR